ncbi:MAG: L-ribulose-5-phosphate 4-epimerase [Clostridia bacterium]|nr:L-ribulose-5-phosphate 4-epimerase [Clostridia bacterium]
MTLKELKEKAFYANMLLPKHNLIIFTWGNVSIIDRKEGYVAIKPSGVPYETMKEDDIVVVDMEGNKVSGDLKPSSDLPTHIEIYKSFEGVGGVCHNHSKWATIFAQAGVGIPAMGTTHADYFYGTVPCTREMRKEEIETEYEKNTGLVIVETFEGLNPMYMPGVLVKNHGPFVWGTDGENAVHNAVVLEELAMMAYHTMSLGNKEPIKQVLLDKHYLRKHGKDAYYGQN